jgi:hypothetical protein
MLVIAALQENQGQPIKASHIVTATSLASDRRHIRADRRIWVWPLTIGLCWVSLQTTIPRHAPGSGRSARGSRRPNETGDGALAPHFRLLELSGGNRPVESRRAHLCRRLGCDGAGFGLAGAAAFFFVALRASSRASCLAARSFAPASTIEAGVPSRAMRWSWESTARQ